MLRGAGADELRAVKRVVWLAVNVAYNLRLEVSYLNDRRACLVPSLLPSFYTPSVSSTSLASMAAPMAAPSSATGGAGGAIASGTAGLSDQAIVVGGGDAGGSEAVEDGDKVAAAGAALVDVGAVSRSGAGATTQGLSVAAAVSAGGMGGVVAPTGAAVDDKVTGVGTEAAVALEGGSAAVPEAGAGVSEAVSTPATVAAAAGLAAVGAAAAPAGGGVETSADGGLPSQAGRVDGDDVKSVLDEAPMLSSSLGVDFGEIPPSFELRRGSIAPAAGGRVSPAAAAGGGGRGGLGRGFIVGGEHFAFQNQNLTIASVWMAQGTQCCTAGLKSMQYYAEKVSCEVSYSATYSEEIRLCYNIYRLLTREVFDTV